MLRALSRHDAAATAVGTVYAGTGWREEGCRVVDWRDGASTDATTVDGRKRLTLLSVDNIKQGGWY